MLFACSPSFPSLWLLVNDSDRRSTRPLELGTLHDDGSRGPAAIARPCTLTYPDDNTQRVLSSTFCANGHGRPNLEPFPTPQAALEAAKKRGEEIRAVLPDGATVRAFPDRDNHVI